MCKVIVALEDPEVVKLKRLAVCRLSMMRHVLDAPELHAFCDALRMDPDLFTGFLRMPASKHHHHSYPGGLFVHSVDVALRMFGSSSIPRADKPLAVAAGLAHDFGKTAMGSVYGMSGAGPRHDKMTLVALAPILSVLRPAYPEFADDLKRIFYARGEARRPKDLPRRIDILLEELLRADHLSCAEGWEPGSSGEPSRLDD